MVLKRRIHLGTHGADVVAVKRGMWHAGVYNHPTGNFTSSFGPFALAALAKLQRQHHIVGERGAVGPQSFAVIWAHMDAYARTIYAEFEPPNPDPRQFYTSPFQHCRGLVLARTDQGVDYGSTHPGDPIGAMGRSLIKAVNYNSGWPGRHVIHGRFLEGPLKGEPWYLAEFINIHAYAGETVERGQTVATFQFNFLDGQYRGIEYGWLALNSNDPCSAAAPGNTPPMPSGIAMERTLRWLGCPTQMNHGPAALCHNPCGKEV